MFDASIANDARPIAILKKIIFVCVVVFLLIGVVSSHRAYFQVRALDLTTSDRILNSGTTIQSSVVTSGRTYADLEIDLIQGTSTEKLAEIQVPANEYGFFDPRQRHAALTATLTSEILMRFQPGPATIRATAFGHSQWTRVPPPVVREVVVEIQPRNK